MAKRIAVVTDSTAYLPAEVEERLGIAVIPLNVIWGSEVLKDNVDIDPPTFYDRLQSADVMPTTSQPSAGEFVDFFQQVADEKRADAIVAVLISSQLSGTIASAEAAKGMMDGKLRIEIVDSLSTSMGLGFQAMAAAEAIQAGGGVEEALEAVSKIKYDMQLIFVVDTLEFLHRGGRIGGAKRLLGTALRIKPILELESGKIEALDQVRTKNKAIARMLEIAKERQGDKTVYRATVVHANAPQAVEELKQQVQDVLNPPELYVCELSPAIGTHTGPGTLGLAYYTV